MKITVRQETAGPVDGRLFGQFLEIASWGEPGPEALVDPRTGRLPEPIVEQLRWMASPVVRFPGGTDVDFLDWTDRIDGAPGRAEAARPISTGKRGDEITNRFGYHEFFALCEPLETEPLIVVNFGAVLRGQWTPERGAAHAAALVAYCNGRPGERGAGDVDWAALRERNGRAEPWGVKYWQIGNETWAFKEPAGFEPREDRSLGVDEWFIRAVVTYAEAMRRVDPQIVLIFDGLLPPYVDAATVLADARIREAIDLVTLHRYQPGGVKRMRRGEQTVELDELTAEQMWYAWVTMPSSYDERGRTLALSGQLLPIHDGYDIAITEWNWNGFGEGFAAYRAFTSYAQGIGVAGYLHGLMREGGRVKLATQSMMLGVGWGLGSISADRDGERPSFIQPTGLATGLYSRHHGDRRLAIDIDGEMPSVEQDLTLEGWGTTRLRSPLPLIDVVATADASTVYVHAINRDFHAAQPVRLDLAALGPAAKGTHHTLTEKPEARRVAERDTGEVTQTPLAIDADGTAAIPLPPRSASILVVPIEAR